MLLTNYFPLGLSELIQGFVTMANTNINYSDSGRAMYDYALKVGKTDTYTVTLTDWIGEDDITTVTVESDDITVMTTSFNNTDKTVAALLLGVTQGRYPVHFSWTTDAGESGCMTGYIDVLDC